MTSWLRKLALTLHVTASVGWLGAVVAFLALAGVSLSSPEPRVVQATFLAMALIGNSVILPLSLAALLTGLVQAVGTPWGLVRHYWVAAKLLLTGICVAVLFDFSPIFDYLEGLASASKLPTTSLRNLSQTLVLHSGIGLLVLLVIVTLSVYKPRGQIPKMRRRDSRQIKRGDD